MNPEDAGGHVIMSAAEASVVENTLNEMVTRGFQWTLPLEVHLLDIMVFFWFLTEMLFFEFIDHHELLLDHLHLKMIIEKLFLLLLLSLLLLLLLLLIFLIFFLLGKQHHKPLVGKHVTLVIYLFILFIVLYPHMPTFYFLQILFKMIFKIPVF